MTLQLSGTTGVSLADTDSVATAAIQAGAVTPTKLSTFQVLGNYANDAAASAGGVAIGSMYRNGSVIMVRVA